MTFNWHSQWALTLCREGKCGKWTFWEACSTFHAYSLNARQLKTFTLQAITAKTCLLRFWNWTPFISLLYNFTPSLNGLLPEKFTLKAKLNVYVASMNFKSFIYAITSVNIQMDVTAMLPDLTEHIRPAIHVFQLLLNFILDKGVKNF